MTPCRQRYPTPARRTRCNSHPTDIVRALDFTSLGIQAATPDADLLEFQDGNGLIKADDHHTVLQLLDDDDGVIVEEIMTCLHGHGYVVAHQALADID